MFFRRRCGSIALAAALPLCVVIVLGIRQSRRYDGSSRVVESILPVTVETPESKLAMEDPTVPSPKPPVNAGRREIRLGSEPFAVNTAGERFENIDFSSVGKAGTSESSSLPALIQIDSATAIFERCTFRYDGAAENRPFAIKWDFPGKPDEQRLLTGKLIFRDCIFYGLAGAIDCDPACSLVLEFENVLHSAGPLIRARRFPAADSPCLIRLSHCTLRESGSLIDWKSLMPRENRMAGSLRVEAKDCIFMPASGRGLLTAMEPFTVEIVDRLTWTGDGNILDDAAPIFLPRFEKEDTAVIRGLVRGTVGFAGLPSEQPEDNASRTWQAPLKTTNPPGINPIRLPMPRK